MSSRVINEHFVPTEDEGATILGMFIDTCKKSGTLKYINETRREMAAFLCTHIGPHFDPYSEAPKEAEYRGCEVWTNDTKEGGQTKAAVAFTDPDTDYSKCNASRKVYYGQDGKNSTRDKVKWLDDEFRPKHKTLDDHYTFDAKEGINIVCLGYEPGEEGETAAQELLKTLEQRSENSGKPVCGHAYDKDTAGIYTKAGFQQNTQETVHHRKTASDMAAFSYIPKTMSVATKPN